MDWRGPRRRLAAHSPLRSFALGGLIGAAGAVAAARRLRRASRGVTEAGLAAFEGAPCFLEHAARVAPDGDEARKHAGDE